MIINSEGVIIRIETGKIANIGRVTQGVKLIQLNENVTVVGIARITAEQLKEEGNEEIESDEEETQEE